ncbi:hypothetical protein GCM10022408_14460 [Hymenobacter fastidiosus]|uniref:histidine kinase n=1 Tax=Hymenobacter fastidiosus TaxID=486264 RepID=A0ABP7RYL0_9BACT
MEADAPDKERQMLEMMLNHAPDLICTLDAEGCLRYVNPACQRVLGYTPGEMVGRHLMSVLQPLDPPGAMSYWLAATAQPAPASFETHGLNRAGQEVMLEWSAFGKSTDALRLCVGQEVTTHRRPPTPVRVQNELYRVLIDCGFDMVGLLTAEGVYSYVGGSTLQVLGYAPEQMVGHSTFDFIHPEDLARVQTYWAQLSTLPVVTVPDFRFRAANGEWKWVETTVNNQLQNPAIRAYAVSSRDITERKQRSFELAESEQRFRLLFENNPALAVFQTTGGLILDANPAFLSFLQQRRSAVLQQPLLGVLPGPVRPLFAEKLAKAATGRQVRFKVQAPDAEGKAKLLSVAAIPLEVDGQTIGVHVMAKDITEISSAHHLIRQQARQLNTILESITDGFMALDRNWNLTYLNREAERIIHVKREDSLGRSIWHFFPEEVGGIFQQNYQRAFDTGETVHFEAFFERDKCWVEVKAFPSPEGLSIYFSDVTARIEADRQLQLLALVAKGAGTSVVITDAQGRTEWVNESFVRHTGYTLADLLGKTPGAVLQGPDTDLATRRHIRERLQRCTPFSASILNYKKTGQKVWFSMDITPIRNEAGQLTQWVAIQQNITYRKETEASQAKMTQDLYQHNRDLQQFTYVISHNLRAPLANALGLAKLLTRVDKDSETFTLSLAHLRQSVEQVDEVLKDLNLVLSIRDKQDVVEQSLIGLAEVCGQAILDLEEPLQQCGGELKLDLETELLVRGNRAYLYSIFYNLLSNSIKYRSDERQLKIAIKSSRGTHGGPSISFTDNGSGFDTYKAGSDVFQLYKRFHTNQRGRGIGLFLVKTHVEAMGGKIEVASGVNSGTRFLIHLDQR